MKLTVDDKVTRKELTGRSSAASGVAVPNHKAGAVPKYLKVIDINIVIDILLMSLHLVVALGHSRVLAIFCSMVFTSDHLCIQSVKKRI